MSGKSSMTSLTVVSIFSKTHPKVTKVKAGYIFDFVDVLSISKQQEVLVKSTSYDSIQGFLDKEKEKGKS